MADEQGVCGPIDALAASAAVVLDPRLADIWQLVWSETDEGRGERNVVPLDVLGALIRLAYLQGYADAVTEDDPGAFFSALGVRDPSLSRSKETRRRRGSGRARHDSSDR